MMCVTFLDTLIMCELYCNRMYRIAFDGWQVGLISKMNCMMAITAFYNV